MTTARDTHNQIEYAKKTSLEEGLAKGREERNMEVAINLLQLGTSCEIVSKATGLSLEELTKLKESQP